MQHRLIRSRFVVQPLADKFRGEFLLMTVKARLASASRHSPPFCVRREVWRRKFPPWWVNCCEQLVKANVSTTMKANDILPASRIPRAAPADAERTVVPASFSQSRRHRRKAHRQRGRHPSRGALLNVLLAMLFVFGAVAAFVVVVLGF